MSQQANINVRMDADLKRDFDKICNDLGLTMSTAITMLAKKMTREKRIPFEISMDPFYSDSNMAAIQRSLEQLEQGKVITKTMEELEAMANE
ncbi:MAG: type II toxin-antitoxin system RelB/DinJ family antitoxin [Peptococcaceae bacterium]|nr:type II toxin-antitoxin system RelB/DinJ family antitoxin [Peptococcaceae bacterium]